MKKKIICFSIGIFICLFFLVLFSILVSNSGGAPLNIDANIRDFFYYIRGEEKNFVFYILRVITELGFVYFAVILGFIYLFITKANNKFFNFVLGLLIMVLLNMSLKDIFQRERPYEELRWVTETSYSFPSGHSATISFMIIFSIYFIFDTKVRKNIKIILYVILGVLAILVPMTRLYFGVHYFSDIISGMSVGTLVGLLMILLTLVMKKYGIFEEPLITKAINYIKNKKEKKNNLSNDKIVEDNKENNE